MCGSRFNSRTLTQPQGSEPKGPETTTHSKGDCKRSRQEIELGGPRTTEMQEGVKERVIEPEMDCILEMNPHWRALRWRNSYNPNTNWTLGHLRILRKLRSHIF